MRKLAILLAIIVLLMCSCAKQGQSAPADGSVSTSAGTSSEESKATDISEEQEPEPEKPSEEDIIADFYHAILDLYDATETPESMKDAVAEATEDISLLLDYEPEDRETETWEYIRNVRDCRFMILLKENFIDNTDIFKYDYLEPAYTNMIKTYTEQLLIMELPFSLEEQQLFLESNHIEAIGDSLDENIYQIRFLADKLMNAGADIIFKYNDYPIESNVFSAKDPYECISGKGTVTVEPVLVLYQTANGEDIYGLTLTVIMHGFEEDITEAKVADTVFNSLYIDKTDDSIAELIDGKGAKAVDIDILDSRDGDMTYDKFLESKRSIMKEEHFSMSLDDTDVELSDECIKTIRTYVALMSYVFAGTP